MTWFDRVVIGLVDIIVAFTYSFSFLLAFSMYIHREEKK